MNKLFRALCVLFTILGHIAAPYVSYAADELTKQQFRNIRKSINQQREVDAFDKKGKITLYAKSNYHRLTNLNNYRRISMSPAWGGGYTTAWQDIVNDQSWKGVFVGRKPDTSDDEGGIPEPIGIPHFTYKLLPDDPKQPRKVSLEFGLADGTRWSFDVAAAVVTPMTIIAVEENPRLGLFTLTAPVLFGLLDDQPAVHPALQGHRLAYRLAISDLFCETNELTMLHALLPPSTRKLLIEDALSEVDNLSKEQHEAIVMRATRPTRLRYMTIEALRNEMKSLAENSISVLSGVVESKWALSPNGLTSHRIVKDPNLASVRFVYRHVHSNVDKNTNYTELKITETVNKEVFNSLTGSEQQLLQEYNDAVIVFRILYAVKRGWIVNFDRQQNWSKMIDDLADVYKANLDEKITAEHLAKTTAKWAADYNGRNQKLPEYIRLK